jgi:hypothetical protein
VSAAPQSYAEMLSVQLQANVQTWERLRERGVDETTLLRLDFRFRASDRRAAERLAAVLQAETDYEVRVDRAAAPVDGATWVVEGRTQSTAVGPGVLDDWVAWMIAAGVEAGGCEFASWGCHVPGA